MPSKVMEKQVHFRDASLFCIFVEGDKAEKEYFDLFAPGGKRVKLVVIPPETESAPDRLFVRAQEFVRKNFIVLPGKDQLWLAFDVDDHHHAERVAREAPGFGMVAVVSNPCFEIWLYLHHADYPQEKAEALMSEQKNQRSQRMKRDWGLLRSGHDTSDRGDKYYTKDKIDAAIERAIKRDTTPDAPIPPCPGTQIYRLMRELNRFLAEAQ
jgi:hypothetical protein